MRTESLHVQLSLLPAAILVFGALASTAANASPSETVNPADEVPSLSIKADRSSPTRPPDVSVAPYGFGALDWAVRHPESAWRIVLPVGTTTKEPAFVLRVQ